MPSQLPDPTPYPEINTLLRRLLAGVQAILEEDFVGMYLYGSLAQGDFNLDRSDIDFLVVTEGALAETAVEKLKVMHKRISDGDSKWTKELEGSYIPRRALRRYDPGNAYHPHIDRGSEPRLAVEHHDADWVIQRRVLRRHGVTLAGPPPQTLIDPVSPAELRRATRDLMASWWAPMVDDPFRLEQPGYRYYAVLTMCRVLYTLRHSAIVSKPAAAAWALAHLEAQWRPLIKRALAWPHVTPADDLAATRSLLSYTVEQASLMKE